MKRSELKVGEAYYYDRGNDWDAPRYGGAGGRKATVVALWAERSRDTWSRGPSYREVPEGTKGAGILVEYPNNLGDTRREVVPPAHLRGPYEETLKQVEDFVAKRNAWQARCPIDGPVNEWVAANVLPALRGMPEDQPIYDGLLYGWESRWRVWKKAYPEAVLVVHVLWPVEARFLLDAHQDPFGGPYPVDDVAPLLRAAGHEPTSVDAYLDHHGLPKPEGSPHHPLYDARAAEAAFRHLMAGVGARRAA